MWLWHDNPGRLCTTINHIVLDHTSRLVNRTTFTLDSYFLKAKIIYLYLIHQIWLRTTLCWLRQQKYQTQPPRTNSLQKTVQIMYYISENNPQRGVSRNMWHRITGIMELFRWTWGQQGGWKENRKNMRGDTCLDFFFHYLPYFYPHESNWTESCRSVRARGDMWKLRLQSQTAQVYTPASPLICTSYSPSLCLRLFICKVGVFVSPSKSCFEKEMNIKASAFGRASRICYLEHGI